MLGCREEVMGKASGIREMGLKKWQLFRLMSSLSSTAHLASWEGRTHCGNNVRVGRNMPGNPEPTATANSPAAQRRSPK